MRVTRPIQLPGFVFPVVFSRLPLIHLMRVRSRSARVCVLMFCLAALNSPLNNEGSSYTDATDNNIKSYNMQCRCRASLYGHCMYQVAGSRGGHNGG